MSKLNDYIEKIIKQYTQINISLERYLKLYIGGSFLIMFLFIFISIFIQNSIGLLLVAFGVLIFISVLLYPKYKSSKKTNQINSNFHLFITHITVLSLSNTDRIEVFRKIANEDDYNALSDEISKFVSLLETFNMSIGDAGRERSKSVDSEIMSDFYEKLSYSLESGQSLNNFLIDEQEDVYSQFSAEYRSRLTSISSFGDLFISIIVSFSFLYIMALIFPIILGVNPQLTLSLATVLFVILQISLIFITDNVAPEDNLWFVNSKEKSRKYYVTRISFLLGVIFTILFIISLILINIYLFSFNKKFILILGVLPLIIPSYFIRKEENKIVDCEKKYSSFIRGLGNIESVKQSSTKSVLKTLKDKNFGQLNEYIDELYVRLSLSINQQRSWRLFSGEVGSKIIQMFSNMYILSRNMGGDPNMISNTISENYRKLLDLREQRKSTNKTFVGLLYGMNSAFSIVLLMGYEILAQLFIPIGKNISGNSIDLLNVSLYNVEIIEIIIMVTIIVSIITSSIMIRIIQRRFIGGIVIHILIMTIVSFGIGYGVEQVVSSQFNF